MLLAAFGGEHAADGVQIQRIGHQRVERVGGNRDHFAAADRGGGALDGALRTGCSGVDFDQVGGHVSV